jgi:hypothetical protein
MLLKRGWLSHDINWSISGSPSLIGYQASKRHQSPHASRAFVHWPVLAPRPAASAGSLTSPRRADGGKRSTIVIRDGEIAVWSGDAWMRTTLELGRVPLLYVSGVKTWGT